MAVKINDGSSGTQAKGAESNGGCNQTIQTLSDFEEKIHLNAEKMKLGVDFHDKLSIIDREGGWRHADSI